MQEPRFYRVHIPACNFHGYQYQRGNAGRRFAKNTNGSGFNLWIIAVIATGILTLTRIEQIRGRVNWVRLSQTVGLEPAPSTKQEEQNHNYQDETETAATVVTDARPHVIAPTPGKQQYEDQYDYQRHACQLSMAASSMQRGSKAIKGSKSQNVL
jgi:hypothetical protein